MLAQLGELREAGEQKCQAEINSQVDIFRQDYPGLYVRYNWLAIEPGKLLIMISR
jgi:hypothetical protein